MKKLFRHLSPVLAFALIPISANSEIAFCDGGQVTVFSDTPELLDTVCSQAQDSINRLSQCNVVLKRPISIHIVSVMSPGCMGVYHCADSYIEILSPDAMEQARSFASSLKHVATPDYFTSILTHELAHAAYENVDCPYEDCIATSEYVAHTMQVMSLPPSDITAFETTLDMTTLISRDSINDLLYFMAPNRFLQKAWIHLNQRPDACSYIADIMAARVHMDRPHL